MGDRAIRADHGSGGETGPPEIFTLPDAKF
jgi:hypothetical protein